MKVTSKWTSEPLAKLPSQCELRIHVSPSDSSSSSSSHEFQTAQMLLNKWSHEDIEAEYNSLCPEVGEVGVELFGDPCKGPLWEGDPGGPPWLPGENMRPPDISGKNEAMWRHVPFKKWNFAIWSSVGIYTFFVIGRLYWLADTLLVHIDIMGCMRYLRSQQPVRFSQHTD